MTPASFAPPASQASSTSTPLTYPRSDADLKTALSESKNLMTYDYDGTLATVAYPCDTEGTPVPIEKLIAYNRTHHFLDVLSCFCEYVYGKPRPVRILRPRGGEHEGDVCLGCPDWQLDGIDPDTGRPAGCRYWVNINRKFAGGWEGVKMVQYPARYGRYLNPRREASSPVRSTPSTSSSQSTHTLGSSDSPSRTSSSDHDFDERYIIPATGTSERKPKRKLIGPPPGFNPTAVDPDDRPLKRLRERLAALGRPPPTKAPRMTTAARGSGGSIQPRDLGGAQPNSHKTSVRKPPTSDVEIINISSSDEDDALVRSRTPSATRRPLEIARARAGATAPRPRHVEKQNARAVTDSAPVTHHGQNDPQGHQEAPSFGGRGRDDGAPPPYGGVGLQAAPWQSPMPGAPSAPGNPFMGAPATQQGAYPYAPGYGPSFGAVMMHPAALPYGPGFGFGYPFGYPYAPQPPSVPLNGPRAGHAQDPPHADPPQVHPTAEHPTVEQPALGTAAARAPRFEGRTGTTNLCVFVRAPGDRDIDIPRRSSNTQARIVVPAAMADSISNRVESFVQQLGFCPPPSFANEAALEPLTGPLELLDDGAGPSSAVLSLQGASTGDSAIDEGAAASDGAGK
ncbi:hypothetical protein C8Q70DRAFT_1051459 [Cubamyces menziesii]|nr:hypothetical protein C8Q70DRAFT_1051459 [Cubamyces menziesii]